MLLELFLGIINPCTDESGFFEGLGYFRLIRPGAVDDC